MNKIDLFKPQDQGGQAFFHLLLRRAQAVSPLCSGGGVITAARKHLGEQDYESESHHQRENHGQDSPITIPVSAESKYSNGKLKHNSSHKDKQFLMAMSSSAGSAGRDQSIVRQIYSTV